MEILVHAYDEEPCDAGLDPYEDKVCAHGFDAFYVYAEAA